MYFLFLLFRFFLLKRHAAFQYNAGNERAAWLSVSVKPIRLSPP